MRRLLNMGLQASPFAGRLRIGLLLMIIGTVLALCEVGADNHETIGVNLVFPQAR